MKKLYDLAVKTGSYMKDGIKATSWENIGSMMEGDTNPDGSKNKFIFLKRTFNPAGVPFRDGASDIIVSMFSPKAKQDVNNAASQVAEVFDGEEAPF